MKNAGQLTGSKEVKKWLGLILVYYKCGLKEDFDKAVKRRIDKLKRAIEGDDYVLLMRLFKDFIEDYMKRDRAFAAITTNFAFNPDTGFYILSNFTIGYKNKLSGNWIDVSVNCLLDECSVIWDFPRGDFTIKDMVDKETNLLEGNKSF